MRSNLLLQLQDGIQHQQALPVLPIVWRAHRVLQGFCYVGETRYNFAVHKHNHLEISIQQQAHQGDATLNINNHFQNSFNLTYYY